MITVYLSALFLASPGSAQPPVYPPDAAELEATKGANSWSWGGQLSTTMVSETNATTLLFSPRFELAYHLSPRFSVAGAWGFGGLVDNQGFGEAFVKAGNPFITVGYRQNKFTWAWKATLGATLPVVRVPHDLEGRLYSFLVNQNLAMHGMWNAWFWLGDFIAFPLQGNLTLPLTQSIPMTIAGAVVPLVGIRKHAQDKEFMAQLSVALDLPVYQRVDISPRLQLVLLPEPGIDRLQSAAALQIGYTAKSGRYYTELLLNLDKPLGIIRGLNQWGIVFGKELDL